MEKKEDSFVDGLLTQGWKEDPPDEGDLIPSPGMVCSFHDYVCARACARARAKVKDMQDVTTHAHARAVLGHFRLWMDTVCLASTINLTKL